MRKFYLSMGLCTVVGLSGCTNSLISSWKAPGTAPFRLHGEKVAAVVIANDPSIRLAGEEALARELSARGVQGLPMYQLLEDLDVAEAQTKADPLAAFTQAIAEGGPMPKPSASDLNAVEKQAKTDPLAALAKAIAEGGPMPKPSASDLNAVEKQAKTDPLAALAQALPRDASPELPLNKPSNDSVVDEARVRAAAEKAGVTAIVVMRPVHLDKEISSRGYSGPTFGGFIGGNLGPGWGSNLESDTVLVIETLVYALPQNKLVWGGQSKSKNPGNVDSLIEKTADQVADEMERQGLILTKSR